MNRSILCTALLATAAAAAETPYQTEPVVVTATRTAVPLDDVVASVTLIDHDRIVDSQADDLLELLRLEAGIDLARTGGPGSQTSLFLRGTNANHVLVLIDGVRAASPHTGAYAWESMPLSQVERIEIVRGPRASYYGSDAIGGVIQIFTRRAAGTQVRAMTGSNGTRILEAGSRLTGEAWALWASAESRRSDGFSSQNPGGFSYDPDDDGFDQTAVSVGLDLSLGESHALRLQGFGSDGEVEFDQGRSDTELQQASARLGGSLGDRWSHELGLSWLDVSRRTPAFFSAFESERTELDWRLDWLADEPRSFSVGLNRVDEEGTQIDTFAGQPVYDVDRSNQAVYLGYREHWNAQQLEISTRFDDNSVFGGEWTAQAAYGLEIGRWRLGAGYGTAFRAPSLSEQYSPGFGGLFAGNPELNPESSASGEISARLDLDQHRLELTAYRSEIDDLISFAGADFQAVNVARARVLGLEAGYRWLSGPWRVEAHATLQDAEDRDRGTKLLRRPDEKASLILERRYDNGALLALDLFWSGERQDLGGTLDAYVIAAVRGRYPLNDQWQFEARIDNLFDQDYELVDGFNTPDRSAFVALRWSP